MSDIFKNIEIPVINTPAAATSTPATAPKVQVATSPAAPAAPAQPDTVEISSNKKTKKGPIKAVKGFIAGVKKFFASAGAYIKGGAKGVATGAVAGSVVYTAGSIVNHVRGKAAEKAGTVIKKVPNKALAGVVAAAALGINLWTASLNATQKQSEIDMRYKGLNQ